MKIRFKILPIIATIAIIPITVIAQSNSNFFLADNGITITCPNAQIGEVGEVGGITYEAVDRALLIQRRDEGAQLNLVCVSKVTDLSTVFYEKDFNQPIGNWDVSSVTNMSMMFYRSTFNQPIDKWDVSKLVNMHYMFGRSNFNQPIGSWDVSNVEIMSGVFEVSAFNQPLNDWVVSKVTITSYMFLATSYNHPLDKWDVSNVISMGGMFQQSRFNQPIGNWNVSSVTDMAHMFQSSQFNQSIENWNVSNVTNMAFMFYASKFNLDISNWNVSKVINMASMFRHAPFNQPVNNWNVGSVEDFNFMFADTPFNHPIGNWDMKSAKNIGVMFQNTPFNQFIGNWNVSNVTIMVAMFLNSSFNQAIGNWDVSKVTDMRSMFSGSAFNQSIIRWCVTNITIEPEKFSLNSPLLETNKPFWGTCPNRLSTSSDTWTLPVRVSSNTGLFASATLGVNPAASDGLDSLDVPAPPTAPGESISLYTNHPEWNWILGSRVAGDIRASVDLSAVPITWELTLSSTGASTGELTLDRPEGLNWPIVVMNGSNRWLSRSGDLVVPFTFSAAGNQTFTVQVGDTTAPELQAGAWFEGPAILDVSATHPLDWQASDLNHLQSVELEVSHDDGATWNHIYTGTATAFNWTPSGSILFNESTRFSLKATDRAGNSVSQSTMSPISVIAPRQAVNWPQGWSIRGSAYAPTNQTNSVMGEAFRYGWTGAGYEQVSGFETGNALWVGSTIAGTDTLAGTVAGQGQNLQLPVGWSMITAPLLRTVYGDSIRVTHSGNGRSLWLSEAIDSMWVTAPLAYVNNAYAAANRMTPFSGYWMGVLAPGVSLELPIHAYSTTVSKESTQEEPMVRLLLQDGAAEQVLSVKQGSGVPAPPAAPNAERVGLRGVPTILGELYLVAGAQVDAQSTHPLVIGGSPRSVTLSWTDQTFAGMTAVLQLTDRRYDLTRANSVTLRTDEAAQIVTGPVSTSTESFDQGPLRTELHAAYPNPFNPSTVIGFTVGTQNLASLQTRLAVYDLLGRQVAVLVDGTMPAGRHRVTFDASGLASGVYLVRLEAGGEVFTRRMTLLK
jgi:surface protein